MLLLFSHKLTQKQKDEAKDVYNVNNFIYLPDNLQSIWSAVSPDITSLEDVLKPIKSFVDKNIKKNDVVLIQGDFGATYEMVNYVKSKNAIAVYATTKRDIVEYINEKGEYMKKTVFEHRRFREYE